MSASSPLMPGRRDRLLVASAVMMAVMAPISIFAVQWFALFVALLALPDWRMLWQRERPIVLGVGAVAISWVLSWAFSPRGPVAFWEAKDMWALAVLPGLIGASQRMAIHRPKILAALGVGIAVAVGYACLQTAYAYDFMRGTDLQVAGGLTPRVPGFYRSQMTFGGVCMLALAAFAARGVAPDQAGPRFRLGRLALLALMAVALVGVALSGTRTYLLALPAVALIVAATRGIWAVWAMWMALVVGVVAILLAGSALPGVERLGLPDMTFTAYPHAPHTFVVHHSFTGDQRVLLWLMGLDCIRDYPLTGTGKGAAGFHWVIEQYAARFSAESGIDVRPNHLHNNLLQILVETGVVGLLASGWLALALLRSWFRAWASGGARDSAGPLAAVFAVAAVIAIAGLFEYNLGDMEFMLLASLLLGIHHPMPATSVPPSPRPPESPATAAH